MNNLSILLLILATLGSGLMAGLFCSFSNFVMKALSCISPPEGIAAMQSINRVIVRPGFLIVFLGTGLASVTAVISGEPGLSTAARTWGIIGSMVYILGSIGATITFNVPLNNHLAGVSSESEKGMRMWDSYLLQWTWWNHIRSFATLASTILFIVAVFYANGST